MSEALNPETEKILLDIIQEFLYNKDTGNIQINFQQGNLRNINKEIRETIKIDEVKK